MGKKNNPVSTFCDNNSIFRRAYQQATIDQEKIDAVKLLMPRGHAIIVAAYWCHDSLNHVPHIAKIAEQLDGWVWEMHPRENLGIVQKWGIRKIPQMILLDPNTGEELGRIIENPQSESIEQDMLDILRKHKKLK